MKNKYVRLMGIIFFFSCGITQSLEQVILGVEWGTVAEAPFFLCSLKPFKTLGQDQTGVSLHKCFYIFPNKEERLALEITVEVSSGSTLIENPLFKETSASLWEKYRIYKEKNVPKNETVVNSSLSAPLLAFLCLNHFAYCMLPQKTSPLPCIPRDAKYQKDKIIFAPQKHEKRPLVSVKKNKGQFPVNDRSHFQRKK